MPEDQFGEAVAATYDEDSADMFEASVVLSEAMVARLRAKPGSEAIGVTIGDLAATRVDGTFSVAYLVFNTLMNLMTQEAASTARSRSATCGRRS